MSFKIQISGIQEVIVKLKKRFSLVITRIKYDKKEKHLGLNAGNRESEKAWF